MSFRFPVVSCHFLMFARAIGDNALKHTEIGTGYMVAPPTSPIAAPNSQHRSRDREDVAGVRGGRGTTCERA